MTVHAEKADDEKRQGWFFLGLERDAKPVALTWKDGVAVITEEVQP